MGSRKEVARGFTLLELIVTLFVLALAVAVVTPAIGRGTDTLRARADVAGFAALLRHTREQAITLQEPQVVVIDAQAHQMSVRVPSAPGSTETVVRQTRALPDRVTVESRGTGPMEVTFDARGISSGADFRVTSGSIVYRVTVDRLTGRVRSTRE